jgi:hypothetical protein
MRVYSITVSEMIAFITFLILVLDSTRVAHAQMYWQKLFDSLSYKQNYKPAPRRDAAIGHDISRNRVIVFGGWQTNAQDPDAVSVYNMPVLFDDTWEFNLDTSKIIYPKLHSSSRIQNLTINFYKKKLGVNFRLV